MIKPKQTKLMLSAMQANYKVRGQLLDRDDNLNDELAKEYERVPSHKVVKPSTVPLKL